MRKPPLQVLWIPAPHKLHRTETTIIPSINLLPMDMHRLLSILHKEIIQLQIIHPRLRTILSCPEPTLDKLPTSLVPYLMVHTPVKLRLKVNILPATRVITLKPEFPAVGIIRHSLIPEILTDVVDSAEQGCSRPIRPGAEDPG